MNHYRIIGQSRPISNTCPVSRDDAKSWARISFTDDDTLIDNLLIRSCKAIEAWTNCSLVTKSGIVVFADLKMPNNRSPIEFEIPYGPIVGDISVEIRDGFLSTDYKSVNRDVDYYIDGIDFPIFKSFICGVYKFTYNAGYTPTNIPEEIKHAILTEFAYRYEHRGDSLDELNLSPSARKLSQPYKRMIWL